MKCLSKEAERCCSQTKNWYSTDKEFRNDTLLDKVEERNKLNDSMMFQNFPKAMVKLSADIYEKWFNVQCFNI